MRNRLSILLLIALGIIIYSNSFGNDFIWDDEKFVIDNVAIRNFSRFPTYFTSSGPSSIGGDNYRPLVPLSYAVDFYFWALNPMGYHLTNTALHIINAILLLFLLSRITKDYLIGLVASLFFLSHPIQTEAVTWISGRSNVLFLSFFLISFLFYLRYRKDESRSFYFLSLFAFIAALLSKEMAASLPFIFILFDYSYGKILPKIALRRYIPFFVALLAYVALRWEVTGRFGQCAYLTGSFYATALTMVRVVAHYLRLLVYPVGLCADYLNFPVSVTVTEPSVIISSGVIFFVLLLGIRLMRRFRHFSFGILWFFVTLVPVLNIIPIRTLMAERFLYLPSIGFFLVLSASFRYLCLRLRKRNLIRQTAFFCIISLVVAYSLLTMARNRVWSDGTVFNENIIELYPDNERARFNLARAYISRQRDFDKAYRELMQTLELVPYNWKARRMLASYYFAMRRFDEAAHEMEYAIRLKPRSGFLYNSLAYMYAVRKKYDLVYPLYEKMFSIDGSDFYRELYTAEYHVLIGKTEDAIKEYESIANGQLDPAYDVSYGSLYLLKGALLSELCRDDEAYRMWYRAEMSSDRHTVVGEISRYLTGKIALKELLSEIELWPPRYRIMALYYVGVKMESEQNLEGAQTYFRRCIDEPIDTVEFYKARAVQRLQTPRPKNNPHPSFMK